MINWLRERVKEKEKLWLFLDYDGTLADFADTPDDVLPDSDLIELLGALSEHPHIRVTIISGRRLAHIEKLVPVKNAQLAGTYGIELRLPDGSYKERLPYEEVRPVLSGLKPVWEQITADKDGFYLEDKGWTLALHARYASDEDALDVLSRARINALPMLSRESFELKGGHKFLEAAPKLANKKSAVRFLVSEHKLSDALLVYLGDDDKDEAAFAAIHELGGVAGVVGNPGHETAADFRLDSPQEARQLLQELFKIIDSSPPDDTE